MPFVGTTPSDRLLDWPETHNTGSVHLVNQEMINEMVGQFPNSVDFGVQISHDGRVWICINGVAWIRFKPDRKSN